MLDEGKTEVFNECILSQVISQHASNEFIIVCARSTRLFLERWDPRSSKGLAHNMQIFFKKIKKTDFKKRSEGLLPANALSV